jgi:hypothetical protein
LLGFFFWSNMSKGARRGANRMLLNSSWPSTEKCCGTVAEGETFDECQTQRQDEVAGVRIEWQIRLDLLSAWSTLSVTRPWRHRLGRWPVRSHSDCSYFLAICHEHDPNLHIPNSPASFIVQGPRAARTL